MVTDIGSILSYASLGERYVDDCVIQRRSFGGGSVMEWECITERCRAPLVLVAVYPTGIRYRYEIVQRYVMLFIQAQGSNVTCQH